MTDEAQAEPLQLVRMRRVDDGKEADVHPAEVENMRGWAVVPQEVPPTSTGPGAPPPGWRDMHWASQMKLAEELLGADAAPEGEETKAAWAVRVLEDLEKRAAEA